MKIGIVSPYAYPRPGGANSYIRESYEQLTALGLLRVTWENITKTGRTPEYTLHFEDAYQPKID